MKWYYGKSQRSADEGGSNEVDMKHAGNKTTVPHGKLILTIMLMLKPEQQS